MRSSTHVPSSPPSPSDEGPSETRCRCSRRANGPQSWTAMNRYGRSHSRIIRRQRTGIPHARARKSSTAPAVSGGGGLSHRGRAAGGLTSAKFLGSAKKSNTSVRQRGSQTRRRSTWSFMRGGPVDAEKARPRAPSPLWQLLHLGENPVRIRQLPSRISLDEADDALAIYDERRADIRVPLRPVDPVVLDGSAVHVGQQWVVRDPDRLGPVLVAERAIRADAQDLGIGRLEVAGALIEGGHARASSRRPVERIEQQDHVPSAILAQADVAEADGVEREVGSGISDPQRRGGTHSVVPSFRRANALRLLMIAEGPSAFNPRAQRGAGRIGIRAGGLRRFPQRCRRADSRGVSTSPRKPAAVTTWPLSQSCRKRSRYRSSRTAW